MFCVYISDGLQQGGSLTGLDGGKSDPSTDDDGIVEDIRRLLTDLVDDVIHEDDCTRKPSKRRAADIPESSSEPKRKRPFSTVAQRTIFNPVAEHHLWCPYVCDIVSDGSVDVTCGAAHKPWLRLLRQLVPDREAALTRVQTSPVPDGIQRIRQLFRTWTSTA